MDKSGALPTPGAVLDYWIGAASHDHLAAIEKNKLWFRKSFATDKHIAEQFLPLMCALASGLAYDWAAQGPRQRLAAIISLDQFSRNVFRGNATSFAHDKLALGLTKEALMLGVDAELTEIERIFLYIPLEHSERMADQALSVELYSKLAARARPVFKKLCDSTLDYAHKHRDVIQQFGRFPHRNELLKRSNTLEEAEYLAKPGSGF
ncbi:MAG: DUF924 family protein [Henriciella sp.]|jgi:uncharacterized protein (DUF924 family)